MTDSKSTDPQQNANVGQPELRKRLEDAQGLRGSKYSNDPPIAVQNGMSQAEYDTWMFLGDKPALDQEYTYAIKQSDLTKLLRDYRINTIKAAIESLPEKRSIGKFLDKEEYLLNMGYNQAITDATEVIKKRGSNG